MTAAHPNHHKHQQGNSTRHASSAFYRRFNTETVWAICLAVSIFAMCRIKPRLVITRPTSRSQTPASFLLSECAHKAWSNKLFNTCEQRASNSDSRGCNCGKLP